MGLGVIHRRESIVLTTIDVMNEYGVQALSTREVARREGISEGAIFKHFSKKKDLMIAVLEYFSKYDDDIFSSTKIEKLESKEAILNFVDIYTTYYQNYPAITSIAQALDEMRYNPELEEIVKSILNNRLEFLTKIIEQGQFNGDIKKDVDKVTLADIIFGTLQGICLRWRVDNYEFSLKKNSLQATQMILEALY
ncbi:MAG: TetR/AcrR family transcriptional regulator [Firmicutes bacterium HGW-Firmicutes-1]|jgi:AcrR family transcriptional regulator|nr:MAG: TetR/AcrR family transcriptional regulator [Firmicutes bacterium HGW-Firmicutes-1]